jgi:hypothetical protein
MFSQLRSVSDAVLLTRFPQIVFQVERHFEMAMRRERFKAQCL